MFLLLLMSIRFMMVKCIFIKLINFFKKYSFSNKNSSLFLFNFDEEHTCIFFLKNLAFIFKCKSKENEFEGKET